MKVSGRTEEIFFFLPSWKLFQFYSYFPGRIYFSGWMMLVVTLVSSYLNRINSTTRTPRENRAEKQWAHYGPLFLVSYPLCRPQLFARGKNYLASKIPSVALSFRDDNRDDEKRTFSRLFNSRIDSIKYRYERFLSATIRYYRFE